jgi:hypothetical protein
MAYTVNSTSDDGSNGTLRRAITQAETITPTDQNTIDFNLAGGSVIKLESALPDLNASIVAIDGPGAGCLTVERDPALGSPTAFSVFVVDHGSTVTISGLTIADGLVSGSGGGIDNSGTLTLTDSTVVDNSSGNSGGGIFNQGTATLTNDTVSSNSVSGPGFGYGGGIANTGTLTLTDSTVDDNLSDNASSPGGGIYSLGTATLTNDTVSSNSAEFGGGIVNTGTLALTDSTLTGNSASDEGGGLFSYGILMVTNSTIANNQSSVHGGGVFIITSRATLTNDTIAGNSAGLDGGGIDNAESSVTLANTIVAENTASTGPDVFGSVTSLGYNLIGNTSGGSGFVGTDILNENPLLAPLGSYGGPTQTMALLPGSPAIHAGSDSFPPADEITVPTTDQRGVARPSMAIDIGAFQSRLHLHHRRRQQPEHAGQHLLRPAPGGDGRQRLR